MPNDDDCPSDPGPLPDELCNGVPGFIQMVIDHNLAGAFKQQLELALAAALAFFSVVVGRKVKDRFSTRTNLYCLGVAPTASGKERGRQVNKNIAQQAGLDNLLGPEKFASSAGLVNSVAELLVVLFQIDEIGRYLKTLGDARQGHLYGIISELLELFSTSSSTYKTPAYSDRSKSQTVYQPCASLYGTTVPQSLYESLTLENLTDGFLSRCLVFIGADAERQEPDVQDVPEAIIEEAKRWGEFNPGGNLSDKFPQPITVPTDPDAEAVIRELEDFADAEHRRLGDPFGPLWSRVGEKARKLALLYACSADRLSPRITREAAEWATAVVTHVTKRMVYIATRWISASAYDAKVKRLFGSSKAVARLARRSQRSTVMRRCHFKERTEILNDSIGTRPDSAVSGAEKGSAVDSLRGDAILRRAIDQLSVRAGANKPEQLRTSTKLGSNRNSRPYRHHLQSSAASVLRRGHIRTLRFDRDRYWASDPA